MSHDELDNAAYYEARADEHVWRAAKELGVSRRRFIELAAVGSAGAMALLGACTSKDKTSGSEDKTGPPTTKVPIPSALVKDIPPSQFTYTTELGFNAEMNWKQMAGLGYLVPNHLFFVRQSSPTPRLTPQNWKLTVSGPGITKPLEFTYDQLLGLPSVSVVRCLECAGNGRAFFKEVLNQDTFVAGDNGSKVTLAQWRLGAVGVAEWTGVPLKEILLRAGLKPTAKDVVPGGVDQSALKQPMSVAKAMEDDTLLVYAMNGDTLPADHGYPVRVLTPGWTGNHSVKWVGNIDVAEEPVFVPQNTTLYVYIGPDYKPEPPRLGPVVDRPLMKTAFELAWPAQLKPGAQKIGGRAWGPDPIKGVEYSVDDGKTWSPAKLSDPNVPAAWVRWSFDWAPTPGEYKIRARAIDDKGTKQPDTVPYNQLGLNYGAVVAHPVTVA